MSARKCSINLPIMEDCNSDNWSLSSLNFTPKTLESHERLSHGGKDMANLQAAINKILNHLGESQLPVEQSVSCFKLDIKLSSHHYNEDDHLQLLCDDLAQLSPLVQFSTECLLEPLKYVSVAIFAADRLVCELYCSILSLMAELGEVLTSTTRIALATLLTPEDIDQLSEYLKESEMLCLGAALLLRRPAAVKMYQEYRQTSCLDKFLADIFKMMIKKKAQVKVFQSLLLKSSETQTSKNILLTQYRNLENTVDAGFLRGDLYLNSSLTLDSHLGTSAKFKDAACLDKDEKRAPADEISTAGHTHVGTTQTRIGKFSFACQKAMQKGSCPSIRRQPLHFQQRRKSGYLAKLCGAKDTPSNLSIFALQSGKSCQNVQEQPEIDSPKRQECSEIFTKVLTFLEELVQELLSLMSPSSVLNNLDIQTACVRTGNKLLLDALIEYAQNKMLHLGAATKVFGIMEELHLKGGNRKPASPSVLVGRFICSLASWLAARKMISTEEKTAILLVAYKEGEVQSLFAEIISLYIERAATDSQRACSDLSDSLKFLISLNLIPQITQRHN